MFKRVPGFVQKDTDFARELRGGDCGHALSNSCSKFLNRITQRTCVKLVSVVRPH